VLSELGRVEEAVALRRTLIALNDEVRGKDAKSALLHHYNLASGLLKLHQFDEALIILEGITNRARFELPDESISYQYYAIAYGKALMESGQLQRAQRVVEDAELDGRREGDSSVMRRYVEELAELSKLISNQLEKR
ncbi:MAG: hypothetical protein KDI56_16000, partial [Xanthomonadales bacterium]|nr:hypothetical protein [Xanthomonadales bacterium]